MTKKQRLRKQADELWKIAIMDKWGKRCYCSTEASSPHHFYPKGLYGHLRYDLDNGVPLCIGHHFSHHHKGDPVVHQMVIEKRGNRWFNSLKRKAHTRPKMSLQTIGYYQDIIDQLK